MSDLVVYVCVRLHNAPGAPAGTVGARGLSLVVDAAVGVNAHNLARGIQVGVLRRAEDGEVLLSPVRRSGEK